MSANDHKASAMGGCSARYRNWWAPTSVAAQFASIVLFASVPYPALSQTVMIVGLGVVPCRQYTLEIEKNPVLQREYLAWAQGFMSGSVMSSAAGVDEKLNLIPPALPLLKQLDLLREYCAENVEKDFVDAVIALHMKLRQLK